MGWYIQSVCDFLFADGFRRDWEVLYFIIARDPSLHFVNRVMSDELGRREVCFDHLPMHALGGW